MDLATATKISADVHAAAANQIHGLLLATGMAVGEEAAAGSARYVASSADLGDLRPGEILMAEFTTPEWEPAMAAVAAIITNQGGRASHAAKMARKLGIPAVVGAIDGASRLWSGARLTVSCVHGGVGRIFGVRLPGQEQAD